MEYNMDFIKQHDCEKISIGKGGADVYIVDHIFILKNVRRIFVEDAIWNSCCREALFYSWSMKKRSRYVPEVIFCHQTNDEISILMKRYEMIAHSRIDQEILRKIANILVEIHLSAIPDFLETKEQATFVLDDESINQCVKQWQEVLSEHRGCFCGDILMQISQKINEINMLCFENKQTLIHGDFHCDNLLMDEEGSIFVCDWQAVSVGNPAGDISFFISRLAADGYQIDENEFIKLYCGEYKKQAGIPIEEDAIKCSMYLSNLNTAFLYWHDYLHGTTSARVASIYDKMTEEYVWLNRYINQRFIQL